MKNKSSRRINKARNAFRPTQPKYDIKTCFDQGIVCELGKTLKGLSGKELTEEQKKELSLKECGHKQWPAFMPACQKCLQENAYSKYYTNKGRKFLDVSRGTLNTKEKIKGAEENLIIMDDSGKKYYAGIDPASSKDNYALTI